MKWIKWHSPFNNNRHFQPTFSRADVVMEKSGWRGRVKHAIIYNSMVLSRLRKSAKNFDTFIWCISRCTAFLFPLDGMIAERPEGINSHTRHNTRIQILYIQCSIISAADPHRPKMLDPDPVPDPMVWWTKLKKMYSWKKLFFDPKKLQFNYAFRLSNWFKSNLPALLCLPFLKWKLPDRWR